MINFNYFTFDKIMLYSDFLAWLDSSQQIDTLGQADPAVKCFSFLKSMADGI